MKLITMSVEETKKLVNNSTPLANLVDSEVYEQTERAFGVNKESIWHWTVKHGVEHFEEIIEKLKEIFKENSLYNEEWNGKTAVWGFEFEGLPFVFAYTEQGQIIMAQRKSPKNKIISLINNLRDLLYGEDERE